MTDLIHTIVVGGGQAGLSVGYHLKQVGIPFLILDASERTGDSWRNRWDSLRLFTPARYSGLDGMPFPAPSTYYPTKDEMADYLEEYAERFDLPIRHRSPVTRVSRKGMRFEVETSGGVYEAENVVIAMGDYQLPSVPEFASELRDDILQLHSEDYRRPSQLRDGSVLVVGAANSGVEIALDLAPTHRVYLSGRHPGHVPFDIERFLGRHVFVRLVLGGLFHRVLTVRSRIGRKAKENLLSMGGLLVRSKPEDVETAGAERVPRMARVSGGLPILEDGRRMEVANVIWATGYDSGFTSWIDFDIFEAGEPRHDLGVVPDVPGLYFIGLPFLHTPSSGMFHGVGRDALRVVDHIASRDPVATAR